MTASFALLHTFRHRLAGGAPWLALGAWVVLLGLVAFLIFQPFAAQRRAVLAELREHAAERRHEIDARLWEVTYQVDSLRRVAENGLVQPPAPPLMHALATLPDGRNTGLEAVPPALLPERIGNIFLPMRREAIPPATERELAMAVSLFPMHKAALASTPELASVRYHSADGWCASSPWQPLRQLLAKRGETSLSGLMRNAADRDSLRMGEPKRNPQRHPYWTTLFFDTEGKGWQVGYAAPVYDAQRFRGVVAATLTLHFLSGFLDASDGSAGQWLIVDRSARASGGRLVAASRFDADAKGDLPDWRDFAASSLGLPREAAPALSGGWQSWGSHLVYIDSLDMAPWSLVYLVPEWAVDRLVFTQLRPAIGLLVFLLVLFGLIGFKLWQTWNELKRRAGTDGLTGLSNRRAFFEMARREQARHLRVGQPYSLLMIDIDHFKTINDRFGHPAGDRILQEFSELLRSLMRAEDLFARIGGEEFVCLLCGSDEARAREIAERLCRIVARTAFVLPGGQRLTLTASFGLATGQPPSLSLEELFLAADQALYRAKETGRNRIEVATPVPPGPEAPPERMLS